MIEPDHPQLSIARQCELLDLARSSYYYETVPESEEDLLLMRLLDEQYTRTPFYGRRKLVVFLEEQGYVVDRKRVRRLMRLMGLETIYPNRRLSLPGEQPVRYSYLLRGMSIDHIDQVSSWTLRRLPGTWLGVSDGDYRLVQSVCAGLGTFHHSGYQLLFGST